MKPTIHPEILERYEHQIVELIQEHRIGPELQVQQFDKYISLINNTDEELVKNFLNAEVPKSFTEYAELIEKYDQLGKNIPIEFDRTFFLGLFDVHRDELMEYMAKSANILKNSLIDRMIDDYQLKSRVSVVVFTIYYSK